jgi:hypothetical protein
MSDKGLVMPGNGLAGELPMGPLAPLLFRAQLCFRFVRGHEPRKLPAENVENRFLDIRPDRRDPVRDGGHPVLPRGGRVDSGRDAQVGKHACDHQAADVQGPQHEVQMIDKSISRRLGSGRVSTPVRDPVGPQRA